MADHKDATEVIIATTAPQSEFSAYVQRLWLPALVLFMGFAGYLAFTEYQAESKAAEAIESWTALGGAVQIDNPAAFASADADLIANVAADETTRAAGAWAKYIEASVRDMSGDPSGAQAALAQLQSEHPDHMLNTMSYAAGDDAETVVERMNVNIQQAAQWKTEHIALFENAAPAEGSQRIKMTTTEGVIVLELYESEAPEHCANFIKLCTEGFYNETKFHRVIANFMIQGGDPNSKDIEVGTWGQGGPGYKIDREENELKHFVGFLAAAKMGGEIQSSGSQFYITTGPAHHLDGQHVVFGKVVEGMETVRIVESARITLGTQRPETPAVIVSTELL
jgi:cyclophilin family peptidyl-prolyl cis-trans isomerase